MGVVVNVSVQSSSVHSDVGTTMLVPSWKKILEKVDKDRVSTYVRPSCQAETISRNDGGVCRSGSTMSSGWQAARTISPASSGRRNLLIWVQK